MLELITTENLEGWHNRDPGAQARVQKSGMWKQNRIVVLVPCGELVHTKVLMSLWSLVFPPNNPAVKILARGGEVGEAYSQAIEAILANRQIKDFEFLLTVEHDNTPPEGGVISLVEAMAEHPQYDAISGVYWTKGEGGVPLVLGDPADKEWHCRPQPPPAPGEVKEVMSVPMGFCLWRLSMFRDERLRKPWFKTDTQGAVVTQDAYFWADAWPKGRRCAVHGGVRVGHVDAEGFVW